MFGLNKINTYKKFSIRVNKSKKRLIKIIDNLKNKGNKIVGYGATAKSVTIMNYCNINNDLINFFFDTTPEKINKFFRHRYLYEITIIILIITKCQPPQFGGNKDTWHIVLFDIIAVSSYRLSNACIIWIESLKNMKKKKKDKDKDEDEDEDEQRIYAKTRKKKSE